MTTINGQSVSELFESDAFKKSLKNAEHVVQYINKQYISLNDSDYSTYADHLKIVLTKLVQLMKTKDALFNSLYQKEHFAGSYPDGLKIGKPTEYDMNLIIKLPVDHLKLEFEDATPSFIMIKGKTAFEEAASLSADMNCWIDDEGYLLQTKFRDWMESVLTKALNTLDLDQSAEGYGNTRCLKVGKQNGEEQMYKIGHKKSGPAMTLKVITPDNCSLDVDLVPAFQFGQPMWPTSVLPLPKTCQKKSWMIIPKPKKIKEGEKPEVNDAREWRMSFLDQEREILSGTGTVKPTIKLLKKLRDANNLKLSSYAIKTVIMLEMEKHKPEFWKNRVAYIFLFMLNCLIEHIRSGHIPFYWDKRDDLLKLGKTQSDNISNRLNKILKDMIKAVETNPYIIAEKLLSKDEFNTLKANCNVPNAIMPTATKNPGEGKGAVPISSQSSNMSSCDEVDHAQGVLPQILLMLEKIHQVQENLPTQLLQVISAKREPQQQDESTGQLQGNHERCLKKQCELEERIARLEDVVEVLRQQISQLSRPEISILQ